MAKNGRKAAERDQELKSLEELCIFWDEAHFVFIAYYVYKCVDRI